MGIYVFYVASIHYLDVKPLYLLKFIFIYKALTIFAHIQVPIMTHMLSIVFAPVYIAHRIALQCGAEDNNGDIINPYTLGGVQNFT